MTPPELQRLPSRGHFPSMEEGITLKLEDEILLSLTSWLAMAFSWSILTNHCVDKRGSTITPVRSGDQLRIGSSSQ